MKPTDELWEQSVIPVQNVPDWKSEPLPLLEIAQQIRELVGAVRVNIIMIGEKLIMAKEQFNHHGEWFPWLEDNFGWTNRTAEKFMTVARAFKSELGSDLNGDLAIEAKALYFLSKSNIPEEVRQRAITESKDKLITSKDAEQMVAEAVAKEIQCRNRDIDKATEPIQRRLKEIQNERDQALDQINQLANSPSENDVIELFKKHTGQRKLTPRQMALLMAAIGKPVSESLARELAKETGVPIVDRAGVARTGRSKEEDEKHIERTRPLMNLITGLEYINRIELSPRQYFESLPDDGTRWFDHAISEQWTKAWSWLEEFNLIWRAYAAGKDK